MSKNILLDQSYRIITYTIFNSHGRIMLYLVHMLGINRSGFFSHHFQNFECAHRNNQIENHFDFKVGALKYKNVNTNKITELESKISNREQIQKE